MTIETLARTPIVTRMQRPRLPANLIPRHRLPAQDAQGLAQTIQLIAANEDCLDRGVRQQDAMPIPCQGNLTRSLATGPPAGFCRSLTVIREA